MANYIVLAQWTEQGIKTLGDMPKRRAASRELAKSLGGEITQVYVTMGEYDLVIVAEAPDDETMAKMMLKVGMQGNLSTRTLRAFNEAEADRLIG